MHAQEGTQPGGGALSVDHTVREKLATASSETYKTIRADMSEIIKTSDWRKARGIGFTEVCDVIFFLPPSLNLV